MSARALFAAGILISAACAGADPAATGHAAPPSAPASFARPVWYFTEPGCQGQALVARYISQPVCPSSPEVEVRSLANVDGYCLELVPTRVVACAVPL